MRKIFAIAKLTLRNAVRSRMVLALLLLLGCAVIAIPLTIKGDGTMAGTFRILISYCISSAVAILTIATLWGGCAAVSLEIEDRTLHTVVTKPVYRVQIWIGKWLGFVLLNTALLTLTGLAVYGLMRWNLRAENLSAEDLRIVREELMVARYTVTPEPPDLGQEVDRLLERQPSGKVRSPKEERNRRGQITRMLQVKDHTVVPGTSKTWRIRLPHPPRPDKPVFLEYYFHTSSLARAAVESTWYFGKDPTPHPQVHAPQLHYSLVIPRSVLEESQTLSVRIDHPATAASSLLIDPDDGIQVLYYAGRFETNLVRALLGAWAQLAAIAALGVTMGTLFSMPVASFTALSLLIIKLFSRTIEASAASEKALSPASDSGTLAWGFHRALGAAYRGLDWVLKTTQGDNMLERLASGRLISWDMTGQRLLVQVVVVCGLLGLMGAGVFRRREVGRPE